QRLLVHPGGVGELGVIVVTQDVVEVARGGAVRVDVRVRVEQRDAADLRVQVLSKLVVRHGQPRVGPAPPRARRDALLVCVVMQFLQTLPEITTKRAGRRPALAAASLVSILLTPAGAESCRPRAARGRRRPRFLAWQLLLKRRRRGATPPPAVRDCTE